MVNYAQHFSTRRTPQSEPIPGTNQVENSAGGYAWKITPRQRLERFLIIGCDGGTYYASEKKLTVENAKCVLECAKEDGWKTVSTIVQISESGRAPKNDPALFALALCIGFGDEDTRKAAYNAVHLVARTGTHLFTLLEYLKEFKKWSAGLRRAVGYWYNEKAAEKLAYQLIKYRQRNNWTHKDALILSHPVPSTKMHNMLYRWTVNGVEIGDRQPSSLAIEAKALDLLWAYEKACKAETEKEVVGLISDFSLPWEAVNTKWLGSPKVWGALLPNLPMAAMIRNLGRMTANGLLSPLSDAAKTVVYHLSDRDALHRAKIHPINVLSAMMTYSQGHGMKGNLSWSPVATVKDALNDAFYASFQNIAPTGKRLALAIDVSGSMDGGTIAGIPGLTPRMAAAAMAMVTARVESQYYIVGFSHQLVELPISPTQRLDDVMKVMSAVPMGGTDCALPMMQAMGYQTVDGSYWNKGSYKKVNSQIIPVDVFAVYTDNETWAGTIHPSQALKQYREESGINAKLAVAAFTATEFSIADPSDPGMFDVVGFDSAAPNLISDFVAS